MTANQVNEVSQNGTITGSGDVRVIIPDDMVDNSTETLVKITLEGGDLTFDLLDNADTLILAEGSSIDVGGGDLIIDDGTLDILTNSAGFTNIGSVVVNSGLKLSVSQLGALSGQVVTQGEGRLDVNVTSAEDVLSLIHI